MGDANVRVDLDALRSIERVLAEDRAAPAEHIRDAIAEIEAARAAPAPSPTFSSGTLISAVGFAQDLATSVLGAVVSMHEAGPSRAERLVAYRCAALTALVGSPTAYRDSGPGTAPLLGKVRAENCGEAAETYAHAMLAAAAEREPQA